MPGYYKRALIATEVIFAVYLVLSFVIAGLLFGHWGMIPLALLAGTVACLWSNGRVNVHISLLGYVAIIFILCTWQTKALGWNIEALAFLIPLLLLCFYNIYLPPWMKIAGFILLIVYRMVLLAYAQRHPPLIPLSDSDIIIFQTLNSITVFSTLAVNFILLSSNLQETERSLRLANQELHREAGTDPLTQLPNRRSMLDEIEAFTQRNPNENFSIAIADIDFFKKVNDTYGHNGGDYTLKELSALFRQKAEGKYRVCRWGGEEFCVFMPMLNLDQAGVEMYDLRTAIKKMPLCFEGQEFSITITIGVAENDFKSEIQDILEQADQKLYRGKITGRDQVVL